MWSRPFLVLCLVGSASLVVVHAGSLLKQLGQSRDGIGQDCDISIDHAMEAVLEALDDAQPGPQDVLAQLIGGSNGDS